MSAEKAEGSTLTVADIKGKVDFAIITTRIDEYEAVLERLPSRRPVDSSKRIYEYDELETHDHGRTTVCVVRSLEQGAQSAQATTRDVIQDLDPRWILLVGIAGGVPAAEFTLGDVLLPSRLHDFSISAAHQDGRSEYEQTGGPMHPTVEKLLGALPGWRERLDDWSSASAVGQSKPAVEIPADLDSTALYGPDDWKERIRDSLALHFPPAGTGRGPKFHVGPGAAASVLVKDADLLAQWQESARQLTHVEMEAGGAYVAARSAGDRAYPLLCVRGISDIVGFRRDSEWTIYAAQVAASFAHALIRSGPDMLYEAREAAPSPARTSVRPLPSGLLQQIAASDPPEKNPASLLNARYGVVPFFEPVRRPEIEELRAWCDDDASLSIRAFVGDGGTGKTRLFIEWSSRLRQEGWEAGFLSQETTVEVVEDLLVSSKPVLVVLDYAESRRSLLGFVRQLAELANAVRSKIRVVLLARGIADWWQTLLNDVSPLRDLLLRYSPMELAPVRPAGDSRSEVWSHAARAFAEFLGKTGTPDVPDLSNNRYERMLYLHMSALLAVEGQSVDASAILDEIVGHEMRYCTRRYQQQHGTDVVDASVFQAACRRLVAAVALRGGATSRSAADELSARVSGPGETDFVPTLHIVHPGRENVYVSALEPDLLAEALVDGVLSDSSSPEGFLEAVFVDADEDELQNGLTVLGRMATEAPASRVRWMKQVLEADVPRRALPAFRVALALGDVTASHPLGLVLAKALEREGTAAIALEIADRIPEETVSLREVAVWATSKSLDTLPQDADDLDTRRVRARLLNNLGNRLSEVGRREDALKAAEEAVEIRRRLAKERPDAFLPDLAGSLSNLGNRLSEVGRREDALKAAEEAVEIRRRLAKERPDAFLPYLAGSLSNLGNRLSEVGRREDALKAAEEAVEIRRRLAKERPDAFLPYLAGSLSNLGNMLSEVGRREDALKAAEEAMSIYRDLAKERPDAFLPDLATSLNNLGNRLSEVGRREDALKAAEEAVEIRRRLAKERPDAFLPDLAGSLSNLGNGLSEVGRREDALKAAEEAMSIYRDLAKERPDAFLPYLAGSLSNLGNRLSEVGRREDALKAAEEAMSIYRDLAKERPDAFLPYLAGSLSNLGNRLSEVGRREDALKAAEEAVEIRRRLAKERPDAFLPYLAGSLSNLGNMLSEVGRREDALKAAEEAMSIYRDLAKERPDAFLPDLATSLNNLGNRLSEVGRREDALKAAEEAVEIRRRLAKERPDAFLPYLAGSLSNLGNRLSEVGRREDALKAAEEAMSIYRDLAKERPDAFLPDLATSLNNLGNRLSEVGRREDALKAAEEAMSIYRDLAKERPDAFLPDLATSLNNLGNRLSEVGRREDALKAAEEAMSIYRDLAKERPDAFLPDLATSLGGLGAIQRDSGDMVGAGRTFSEGITVLAPRFEAIPEAFAPLMQALVRDYLAASKTSDSPPDEVLLGPILKALAELDR